MPDLSEKVTPDLSVPYALHGFGDTVAYRIDMESIGALATGTNTVVQLPPGKVPLGGYLLVTKAAASAGAATVALAVGSAALVAAVGKANLVEGTVIPIVPTAGGTTKGSLTEPTPVTVTVAGAALTEFEFFLVLKTADLTAMTTNG